MSETGYTVAIVVDPAFGDQLPALAARVPVWIADTPVNRAAAERSWQADEPMPRPTGVTTFRITEKTSPEEWCASILGTVIEHHGEYSQHPPVSVLEIIGAAPTEALGAALARYGFTNLERAPLGFRARTA